jgi:cell fate regulator YaaT (PSP1 superfamily)
MPDCIGVRFDNGPKVHFLEVPSQVPPLGARCVVSTRRGLELGLVRTSVREHAQPSGYFVRIAQPDDLERFETLKEKADELKWLLKARARERNLNVKIVHLEFTLDESLLLITYSTEQQLSLRALAQELTPLTGARLEFENVGPRDQARIIGTIGVCGSGSCSSTWLQGFSAVSIRMARDQQLPLNPEKISGPCGRLMCCLQYEHDMYRELLADLPKKGSKACHTETGACGRVVKLHPLKGTVDIAYDEGGYEELPPEKLERLKSPNPKRT